MYEKAITAADIGLTAPIDISSKFDARDTQQWQLMGRITQAFGKPISDRFVKDHKIDATEEEIAAYKKMSRKHRQKHLRETEKQLEKAETELLSPNLTSEARVKLKEKQAMLDRLLPRLRDAAVDGVPTEMARLLLVARNTERELLRAYGGRVIFQQFGPEALDARRLMYEEAEKDGDLTFDDAGVRHLFYYYSNMKHNVVDEKVLGPNPGARSTRKANVRVHRKAPPRKAPPKSPRTEKTWVISESTAEPVELAPKQIIPVESGVWFGGRQPGSNTAPIGFLDLKVGHVTLLLENGSANWNAVGTEAIAVQQDRKSLVRLHAAEQSVATWDQRPVGCRYFSQVVAYKQRFCISSPYNPLWVYDPWLRTWQKIELDPVTDSDTAKLGLNYYRPTMRRFVIEPSGDLWGFQETRDATRGNAVCHYAPEKAKWEQHGFPWAMARGDDHWPIGVTNNAVWFTGPKKNSLGPELLLFDQVSHQWSKSPSSWPEESSGSAAFTRHGLLIPVGNKVKKFVSESSAWTIVASLDKGERITAVAASGASLYLATTSGIHVLKKIGADRFGEPKFTPWKFTDQTKSFSAVFKLAS